MQPSARRTVGPLPMHPMHLGFSIRQLPLRALLSSSVLFFTALLFTASSHSAQGENGYLRGRGGLVVALSYSSSTFEEEITTGNFSDVDRATMGLYMNYGLCDDLDIVVQPLFSSAHALESALPGNCIGLLRDRRCRPCIGGFTSSAHP
ncbi:MAG: hypothetical protein ACI8QS_001221 [Planctomycetota bacterium]|jgi:hypothetical protein